MEQNKQKKSETDKEVYIRHVFKAERELVFKAWTGPKELPHWYAPRGCEIIFKELDIREGGRFHSCVKDPEFGDCWCKGTYLKVEFPHLLVYTMELADAAGKNVDAADAGMDEGWPAITTVTVTFNELADGTEVILHQTVSEPLAKKTGAYPSWINMLTRLEKILEK
jgi:uncharacterized protein YndB with AHSA1/START domain